MLKKEKTMKIKSLYLDKVGNFKDCKIEFNNNRNALFGVNGIGKTTILDSIASFFYLDNKVNKPFFFRKDFDDYNKTFEIEIEYKNLSNDNSLLKNEDNIIKQSISNKTPKYKNLLSDVDKNKDGKIVYFTSNRTFYEKHSLPKPKIKRDNYILKIYDNSKPLSTPNELHEFIIYNELNIALDEHYDKNINSKSELKELINTLFKNKTFDRVDTINGYFEVVFIDKDGSKFTLFDLSHGEKLILMFVIEFFKNRWENSVILIDEPELGLHIDWQMKLIPTLEKLGKNNQFIIATHSEEIIYIFEDDEIFYIGE